MKRQLACLALLCGVCFGQTTVTGTVQDTSGNLATSGYVEFDIIPQNQATLYHTTTLSIVPQKGRCGINASGQIRNTALTAACQVWGNDVIIPANTLYKVILAPNNQVSITLSNTLISGTTVDLANLQFVAPQPVIGTVINGSPLITMAVMPATDSVWNL